MRRRKNADDTLRAAERAYTQDPSAENQKRYWRELLRVDRLPKYTYALPRLLTWLINGVGTVQMYLPVLYMSRGQIVGQQGDYTVLGYDNTLHRLLERYTQSQEEAENAVKEGLRKLLAQENPRRINADDALRVAERRAQQTKAPEDILAYWQTCLRAKVVPKYTTKLGANSYIWTLYPEKYDAYWENRQIGQLPNRVIWEEDSEVVKFLSNDFMVEDSDIQDYTERNFLYQLQKLIDYETQA